MRTYLASLNWTDLMKDKTATECWIILKDEIEGIIETFVPIQNQGKRSRKKHLSKEAIRKIAYKQIMWRIYRNTGNIEDYNNYKKALNLATAEMRKSKRSFEQKLANDIKNDSNVKICEPLGSSDHNQIHFSIKYKQRLLAKSEGGEISIKANINK